MYTFPTVHNTVLLNTRPIYVLYTQLNGCFLCTKLGTNSFKLKLRRMSLHNVYLFCQCMQNATQIFKIEALLIYFTYFAAKKYIRETREVYVFLIFVINPHVLEILYVKISRMEFTKNILTKVDYSQSRD